VSVFLSIDQNFATERAKKRKIFTFLWL